MLRNTGVPIPVPARALAAAPPGAAQRLPVQYFQQSQGNWCWAACCQMVFDYYHTNALQQCDLASAQFGASCCVNPSGPVCNQGEWPDSVYPKYNVGFTRLDASMSQGDVAAEIAAGRPVEVYYAWAGGRSAHVALIVGVLDNNQVWVHDPWAAYGSRPLPFSYVQSAYNLGAWTISYSSIKPSTGVV
jgi:hypothetical protein